jgi:hypothetical protein
MMRLFAFLALLVSAAGLRAQDQFINWRTNYREALREAAQTKKPLFLEFRCEA